ncbi:putative eukaryotic translation initiation factor 3, gamma subunit [Talaromyces proteolyticus]|uniref:tRNA (adenine(58)-N(1))-methyltransferase non-catalytic subunit TRM6 n=1 Tax=Talaromyces proteolyticus TaxID=1131652 RepID=A0AAD4KSI3_9EURO|nr:putative eukaryotic translation initiation factor 3, gamma subunit [Talaromyces proteolyticus]KAH8697798.1 putative eukaryotic translation initiation factor 3, gamma subunit [Talaromyces proteolyticus]
MHSVVRPNAYVALHLSSGLHKVLKVAPNMKISLGKYGSFYSNHIIGRPFHLTFELLEEPEEDGYSLRIVPAAELHAEALISEGSGDVDGVGEELDGENSDDMPTRTNRDIVDDNSSQALTLDEIEELKRNSTGAGQEIIDKLLESHSAIDKKTAFSLAKYKVRKRRKYLKRFTVLPLDVKILTEYILQGKEPHKIMEIRDEMIGLLGCWGNVHHAGNLQLEGMESSGRYLVVDDTGGLVVAAMAERMGILYPQDPDEEADDIYEDEHDGESTKKEPIESADDVMDVSENNGITANDTQNNETEEMNIANDENSRSSVRQQYMAAGDNSITVIHAHSQPNLSILKYFGYDVEDPDESHPLYKHLKTVSWLQVIDPEADNLYHRRPESIDAEILKTWKPRQRGTYYRKHTRWARIRSVVDEVRAGGFNGLVVASLMEPESVLQYAVPLLRGGASTVVYSAAVEPLTRLMDQYSTPRRSAFILKKKDLEKKRAQLTTSSETVDLPSIESTLALEFPLDPTLLIAPMLQTSRVRQWQVLPGRTHPLMSDRGGAEGYIFHGLRVIPATEHISSGAQARRKKRKLEEVDTAPSTEISTPT